MFTISRISPSGIKTTYCYDIGRLAWAEEVVNVVVIHAFPLEGGTDAGVDPPTWRAGILAKHPELTTSVDPLAVVIKTPPGLPAARWRLVSFWDTGKEPDLQLRSLKIPAAVVDELELPFLS
jgi:hypothetical protein